MRIGVDVDGVLNNISDWHITYGSKFCLDHHIHRERNMNAYFLCDLFSLTEAERDKFWKPSMIELVKNIPVRPFAAETIHKLREMGHTIVILTARDNQFLFDEHAGKMDEYTEEWLKKNGIEYDEILTGSKSKIDTCLENNIDLMIEDKDKNVLEISKHIPVLCFDALHNQSVVGPNIHRIYCWPDVLHYFEKTKDFDIEILEVI